MSEQSPEQAVQDALAQFNAYRTNGLSITGALTILLTEREAAAEQRGYERGRREGLEEAARIVDEEYRGQGGTRPYTENTLLQIAGAIRQAGEGDRGPCPVCGSGDWSCGH